MQDLVGYGRRLVWLVLVRYTPPSVCPHPPCQVGFECACRAQVSGANNSAVQVQQDAREGETHRGKRGKETRCIIGSDLAQYRNIEPAQYRNILCNEPVPPATGTCSAATNTQALLSGTSTAPTNIDCSYKHRGHSFLLQCFVAICRCAQGRMVAEDAIQGVMRCGGMGRSSQCSEALSA